jgi:hypothetical protein
MASFLKNPLNGGTPAIASAPGRNVVDVLLPREGVDHAPGAEEQQGLEEPLGEKVEDSRGVGSHTQPEEHIAEPADGGIEARILLMSVCTSAMLAAKRAVRAPTHATTSRARPERSNRRWERATM